MTSTNTEKLSRIKEIARKSAIFTHILRCCEYERTDEEVINAIHYFIDPVYDYQREIYTLLDEMGIK